MKYPIIFGSISAGVSALLTLLMFFMGQHDDPAAKKGILLGMVIGFVGFVVTVTMIVLAIRAWRNAQADGGMSYGRGVALGALTGVAHGFFASVFSVLYMRVINPAFFEAMQHMQQQQLASMPGEGRAVAETMMKIMFNPAVQIAAGTLMWAVGGTIIGLIGAAVFKREPTTPPPTVPAL